MEKQSQARPKALSALFATATLWSFSGVLIKLISWNPMAIAGVRSLFAAVFLIILVRRPKFKWSFPQIGGAISYAVAVILFVYANKMTTSANAILLQYTAPVFVAIFGAWFLKERTRRSDWVMISVILCGMVLFFLDKLSPGNILGNIMAIISGVAFAGISLFMRAQKDSSPMESVILGNILTVIVCLPFYFQSTLSVTNVFVLIVAGFFQLGLPYYLYSYAIKRVSALECILVTSIEPIMNPIWVLLFTGEVPGGWAIVGGLIILATVTVRSIKRASSMGGE